MTPNAPPDNQLLRMLSAEVRAEVAPVRVSLRAQEVLAEPGTPALHAYFPLTGVISLVSKMENGASAEVALIGREGMLGLGGVFGAVDGPTTAIVEVEGFALRAPIGALRAARLRHGSVQRMLDLYAEARLIQVSQTAACNRLHSVDARLARWLLAIDDRIEGGQFTLTQEFMAQMLGVHRPTVSLSLRDFRESGAIAYEGRSIRIASRRALEQLACECHRVLRREFDRLLRPDAGHNARLADTSATSAAAPRGDESAAALETMREIAGRLLLASIREREAREEADEAIRAKDQFLATVSHELRTPLNAILGWCATLARANDSASAHGVQVIQRNAAAQLKLVEELLDAARLTSATLSIEPAMASLADVLQGAIDAIKPSADSKGITLRSSIPATLPPIWADASRLRQVFLNVLANAVKFTDAGVIDVSVSATEAAVAIVIRDSGRGIPAALLPLVFDRFHQGAQPSGGLGLGLSIARAIAELHGGTIEMASAGEGRGATSTITLPLCANPLTRG